MDWLPDISNVVNEMSASDCPSNSNPSLSMLLYLRKSSSKTISELSSKRKHLLHPADETVLFDDMFKDFKTLDVVNAEIIARAPPSSRLHHDKSSFSITQLGALKQRENLCHPSDVITAVQLEISMPFIFNAVFKAIDSPKEAAPSSPILFRLRSILANEQLGFDKKVENVCQPLGVTCS